MQANWSLILNVLLLIGVIVAIGRLMKARRLSLSPERYQPSPTQNEKKIIEDASFADDIIAVRKINNEPSLDSVPASDPIDRKKSATPRLIPEDEVTEQPKLAARPQSSLYNRSHSNLKTRLTPKFDPSEKKAEQVEKSGAASSTIMLFVLAKENRQFAGYELLQTVLASGLRFGDSHLFHRHEFANGQGSILCSLAAATATGVFDLQNIGAFSVRGLCLFMHVSRDSSVNAERLSIMLETGRQLCDGLDAHLLDDHRRPLTKERIAQFHQTLNIEQTEDECVEA